MRCSLPKVKNRYPKLAGVAKGDINKENVEVGKEKIEERETQH